MDTSKRLPPERESEFPRLIETEYGVTSPEDSGYNCIAYAAEDQDRWWDPFAIGHGYHWPEHLERKADIPTFVKLFSSECGYTQCDSEVLEAGYIKIALYVDDRNEVTHAARQLEDGTWTSKLGDWEDINHRVLKGLCQKDNISAYGRVGGILKRPRNHPAR